MSIIPPRTESSNNIKFQNKLQLEKTILEQIMSSSYVEIKKWCVLGRRSLRSNRKVEKDI